ncbi:AAA family ATPase [Mycoplasma sp. NEAQ87857]|uniref:ATP-binding protein n=1 Tax=Mycoplasma sp. NEAQ87857 TaxID=2683967 RepID=UPI00131986CE|nr:AAA family ATPase [Mycoplasma sp. NEAQ87857]QGZ97757.1 AAA family ATPase [Mycoplasma sp. NEAQ87857]
METLEFSRFLEEKVSEYLQTFGCVVIKGPRFVGKTYLSKKFSKLNIDLSNAKKEFLEAARISPHSILEQSVKPVLIDEWQLAPQLWTAAKNIIDEKNNDRGLFIFTGSVQLKYMDIKEFGIGRFGSLELWPLSLYESRDSNGAISLKDIKDEKFKTTFFKEPMTLEKVIQLTFRGGFPVCVKNEGYSRINKEYIKQTIESLNIIDGYKNTDKHKFEMFLRLMALRVGNIISNENLINQLSKSDSEKITRPTINKYMEILRNQFLIDELSSYDSNVISPYRIIKKKKLYFYDPSLALAAPDFCS